MSPEISQEYSRELAGDYSLDISPEHSREVPRPVVVLVRSNTKGVAP
jgi:hypothetical protein